MQICKIAFEMLYKSLIYPFMCGFLPFNSPSPVLSFLFKWNHPIDIRRHSIQLKVNRANRPHLTLDHQLRMQTFQSIQNRIQTSFHPFKINKKLHVYWILVVNCVFVLPDKIAIIILNWINSLTKKKIMFSMFLLFFCSNGNWLCWTN